MKRKKTWTQRVGDFVAGKGFYIVLLLCVAAIGISGYYLITTFGSSKEDVAVAAPTKVVVTPAPSPSAQATPAAPSLTPRPSAEPSPSPTAAAAPTAAPSQPSATPAASAPAAHVFTWPVKGEVLAGFSLEVLAYDETMGDWRTHCGVDIAADVGADVIAISDGTVEQVFQDDLMGTTVILDHGDGLVSVYSNLASVPAVAEGDQVSTGSVIGSVGTTALAERSGPSHLHLEIQEDGRQVDPVSYLPKG